MKKLRTTHATALFLALVAALLQEKASGRGDSIESASNRRSLLVHGSQASKSCSLIIKSEQKLSSSEQAPASLSESVVEGKWGYQQTNEGVIQHSLLSSEFGQFDLWVEKAAASEWDGGSISEVSTLIYVTSQTENTEGYMSSVTVRAEGWYDADSGLLCLLGCEDKAGPNPRGSAASQETSTQKTVPGHEDEDSNTLGAGEITDTCDLRLLLRFRKKEGGDGQAVVKGKLESLRQAGEASFFSPIVIKATTGDISSQVTLFQVEMVFESVVYALQAACIGLQIAHVRRSQEGSFVSLTMILVQVFVYGFNWVTSLYYPLRYLNSDVLVYFLSDVANIPRFVEFTIFILYLALAIMVDLKRRKGKRQKSATVRSEGRDAADVEVAGLLSSGAPAPSDTGPGTSERQLAVFFWPLYIVIGVCMWYNYDFDTFLRESTFLFLLPQVLANFIWDPSEASLKAVNLGYAAGITLLQMIWVAYEVMRPRLMGYDSFFAFPHTWCWSSMFLMVLQSGLFIGQRFSGGRFKRPTAGMSLTGNQVS